MQATFNIWKSNRNWLLKIMEEYSLEQLNKTPEGFSNNLIWNFGHIVVTQQLLVYSSAKLPIGISREMKNLFKPGSKPERDITQQEADEVKALLTSQIQQTKDDYAQGKFETFREFTTSTGFHIANTQGAFEFNNYHEGLHLGLMLNIRKFV